MLLGKLFNLSNFPSFPAKWAVVKITKKKKKAKQQQTSVRDCGTSYLNSKSIYYGPGIFRLDHRFSGSNDEVWTESPVTDENIET